MNSIKTFIKENIIRLLKEDIINISNIILKLRNEYREEYGSTAWDINNGLCDQFAQDVIDEMGGYKNNLYELSDEMFFNTRDPEYAEENWKNIHITKFGVWSIDMLNKYGGLPININIENINDEINHTWIFYNGKHYDAEVPHGVERWCDLPLVQKFFIRQQN